MLMLRQTGDVGWARSVMGSTKGVRETAKAVSPRPPTSQMFSDRCAGSGRMRRSVQVRARMVACLDPIHDGPQP